MSLPSVGQTSTQQQPRQRQRGPDDTATLEPTARPLLPHHHVEAKRSGHIKDPVVASEVLCWERGPGRRHRPNHRPRGRRFTARRHHPVHRAATVTPVGSSLDAVERLGGVVTRRDWMLHFSS